MTGPVSSFLNAQGWADAHRMPLAGDGSARRYTRLESRGRRCLLMECPSAIPLQPFLDVDALLRRLELSAPEVLAADPAAGFALIEDFGDGTFTRLLAEGADETGLYTLAVDLLIALHRRAGPADLVSVPPFDDARALDGLFRMLDWYWPAMRGAPASDLMRHEFEAAWRQVLPAMRLVPDSIALFDYHTDNLFRLDRAGIAACGLIDFQDAVRAPVVFDLATLLDNDRRAIPDALRAAMIDRYLAAFPALDRDAFMTAYAVKTAHWNTRIVGTFARLLRRDGKPGYQRFMPRVWALVARHIAHPALAPVAEWYRRYLPPADRRVLSDKARSLT
ncbi:MAG TPA: phosphotransferase [Dongiaceae bacterium]|nr:phosphotransferase [Dongiaceae bacterium]